MINKRLLMAVLISLLAGILGLYSPSPVQANYSENILTPEAHQVLTAGSTADISWKGLASVEEEILFSSDGGMHWNQVAGIEDTPKDHIGHYSWTVPNVDSDLCLIQLRYRYVDLIGWHSGNIEGGMFSIKPATIVPQLSLQAMYFIAAPINLEAGATGSSNITLNWEDKSTNEDGFKLERKTEGQSYEVLASLPANTETYNDETAEPGTEYSYRVKAYKGSSSSAYSNEDSASTETEAIPPAPAEPGTPTEPGTSSTNGSGGIVIKFYIGRTEYYVNGKLDTMDTAPVIFEGRTVLPIRYVADALGAEVTWNAQERKVTVNGTKTIELSIDNPWARVNGALTFIDPNNERVTPVILPPGRTMLPLRFTAETLGCSVEWKPDVQEITLHYTQS
ncbi:stalk domain-containing protein [Pelotomaculum propionicicum]|uniref:stalk domain-containing protein n=1 Tax=Pelotomaculum propionicicum TaxID=258475 RepID=UPI003B7D846D